jgi:hypothetical protein
MTDKEYERTRSADYDSASHPVLPLYKAAQEMLDALRVVAEELDISDMSGPMVTQVKTAIRHAEGR